MFLQKIIHNEIKNYHKSLTWFSTENEYILFLNYIHKQLYKNKFVAALFFEVLKAFNMSRKVLYISIFLSFIDISLDYMLSRINRD